mmetsp:Transcript_9122/g.15938  ORF Transcript_9122/g.15938 Transcript_9122/m.15938 type:complete len:249 (+) Transcript_9122:2088-2834(+)
MPILFGSEMRSKAAVPRWLITALMASSALRASSWYLSKARRLLTSSFSRASRMRPSDSAFAFSLATSFCKSAAYPSAARRSAWICCSMRSLSPSCRAEADSCILTISASRCRWSSCSAKRRLRASSSSYCFMRAATCERCSSSLCSSWKRTLSRSDSCCARAARNSASLDFISCCLVSSCCFDSSNTCLPKDDLLISLRAAAPLSRATGSNIARAASASFLSSFLSASAAGAAIPVARPRAPAKSRPA